MAELPNLSRAELEELDARLHELLNDAAGSKQLVGERLKRFAGAVQGLPRDMAQNHDHYLHGRPKK